MMKWLKRIGIIVVILVMLEVVAWFGIFLFGEDAFNRLKNFYFPKVPTPATIEDKGSHFEKCSTFGGEVFCIKEEKTKEKYSYQKGNSVQLAEKKVLVLEEKCSTFEGEIFCIKEDNKTVTQERNKNESLVEKCTTFEDDEFCIKERK